jgi:hypothetical protein
MELYEINIRNENNFYPSQPRLSIYRYGVYLMGIKAFNHLPSYIKKLSGVKNQFKSSLNNYLLLNCFYSLNYFFNSER